MEYNVNHLVEFTTDKPYSECTCRTVHYRIIPNQLPWWKRNLIFNPWRSLYLGESSGNCEAYFSKREFMTYVKPMKTLGDVLTFLKKQNEIIQKGLDDWSCK